MGNQQIFSESLFTAFHSDTLTPSLTETTTTRAQKLELLTISDNYFIQMRMLRTDHIAWL